MQRQSAGATISRLSSELARIVTNE
jgi:hypothetical protein